MIERFDQLTDNERALLSHAAKTQAAWAEDPRYRNADLSQEEIAAAKRRWLDIADSLHGSPYREPEGA